MDNNICYINQSAGSLDVDIVHQFTANGKKVEFYTGSDFNIQEIDGSVKIIRLKSYNRKSAFSRLFSWLLFTLQVSIRLIFKRSSNIFLVSNPPFSVFIAYFLRLHKISLLVWDIYPDILVTYRYISEQSLLYKIWAGLNRKIFLRAKVVFTIGNRMRDVLLSYSPEAQIVVVPLWTNLTQIPEISRSDNFFAKKTGIENDFVIMYSGNLGMTHDVEFIVDLAILMHDCESIRFVIIGEGFKKDIIKKRINESGVANCILLPLQDRKDLPYTLSCADIGIVSLSKDASKFSVPSKMFNMMSAGQAFLAIAGEDSEVASIIKSYNIGRTFNAEQLDKMKDFILELKNDKDLLATYRTNSKKASLNFTKLNAKRFNDLWFN